MAEEQPTLDETVWSHTPKQVLDLLPDDWSLDLKKREIASRMQAGTIRTAALRRVMDGEPQGSVTINPPMWLNWAYLANDGSADSFWRSASFAKIVGANTGFGDQVVVQLFGVRLHGADVSAMFHELGVKVSPGSPPGMMAVAVRATAMQPSIPSPKSPAPAASKVDPRLLSDWVRGFATRNPDSPFGIILQNARAAIPISALESVLLSA